MNPNSKASTVLAVAALCISAAAYAHHSTAMFDHSKQVTLDGTVKEFQFNNPHCFIQLLAVDSHGEQQEWSIELGAPAHLIRHGWTRNTVRPGDKLKMTINPLKDGNNGGLFVSATNAEGKDLGVQP